MPEVSAQPKQPLQSEELNIYGKSLTARGRSGSISPYLENKKSKNSTIKTYPKIDFGVARNPDIWNHWNWMYCYEIKIDEVWKNRSIKVPVAIAPTVKKMICDRASVSEIIEFIKSRKK
jgi:hypothetical protein